MEEKEKNEDNMERDIKIEVRNASVSYGRDFMILRNAILDNCIHCIRDCGMDCLDAKGKPMESINCPLQKVRMDYDMVIHTEDLDSPRRKGIMTDEEMRV